MKKPVVLVIMDGLGDANPSKGNSVELAEKPFLNKIWSEYPTINIRASEEWVGLPKGQMGNSEVGHLNIGAGRIVYQSLVRINKSIEEDNLKDYQTIKDSIEHAKKNNSNVHIFGCASDGGVHSHNNHIIALDKIMKENEVSSYVHAFTDGRDVEPTSANKYIKELIDSGAQIASISGRYYSMDRDQKWDREMMAYNVMTKNEGASFTDALEYIESEKLQGRNDEFIIPSFNSNLNVKINDNDVVIFANFRPDRARQLSHLFIGSDVYEFNDVERKQNLFFASMMEYANINTKVIFQPEPMVDLLGETISKAGLKQMRAAETEKYPHVTFFLDGGKEIDHEGQIKILANSPKVATYDLQPEMSAPELTDKILENIENVDVAIINYANPDMVGHTGSIEATKKAVETVDYQASRIFEKVTELGGVMMVTADHGNAEQMLDENGEPWTAHTIAPVKFTLVSNEYKLEERDINSKEAGKLGDIAPTILELAGVTKPLAMTGKSLIKK